jgi:predicted nuclease of predicted toxin-antitoxin system
MRFLIDESVVIAVTRFLRDEGHDVVAVAEVTPRALDVDILKRAAEEDRIIVTNDTDFGELVFRSRQPHRGVLLLRLRDGRAANQVRVVSSVLSQHSNLLAGHFVVASETGLRVRGQLPEPENHANSSTQL